MTGTHDQPKDAGLNPAPAEELQALFAAMTDRVLVLDREGRYLRIPQTNAPDLFDDPTALLGRTLHEIRSKERADLLLNAIRDCLDRRHTVTVEYRLEPPNDHRWMAASISPMFEEKVVVVVRDITERVTAQAELERRVEERTRELSVMLDTSAAIGSTIELGPLLELIIDRVREVADYRGCCIYLVDQAELRLQGCRSVDCEFSPVGRLSVDLMEPVWDRLAQGEVLIVEDIGAEAGSLHGAAKVALTLIGNGATHLRSWMAVPLASKDKLIGMLALSHSQPSSYADNHARLVRAIATQAAVSIENAQLHQKTLQMATIEERQRLARELHDSVSQALYGIALGARTATSILEPESKALPPVEYVLSLAEAGMAEMRALIFELRPESLEVEGIVAAIDKQVRALRSRYEVTIETELPPEPALTLAEKEVLYRISQEALHNVVKHANASQATVRLADGNVQVMLEVSDDGAGFDTSRSFPGHIGLMSMKERAESVGALLEVESSIGKGTTIRVLLNRRVSPDA